MPVALRERKQETPVDLVKQKPSGVVGETFGERLRRLRTERGLSLADLSRLVHYSRGHLSKVENGQKPASTDLALGCDEALGADGALAALAPPGRSSAGAVCPYPGLASFGRQDAPWFFGRERATAALVGHVTRHLLRGGEGEPVVVVGPSGAGKSSLLHAGLLPAIARGALPVPGAQAWPSLCLTPSSRPTAELVRVLSAATGSDAEALRQASAADPEKFASLVRETVSGHRGGMPRQADAGRRTSALPGLVLVVDQFEEVFTLCDSADERRRFVRALHALSRSASRPAPSRPAPRSQARILVVLGVRADYYGQCLSHPELVAALRGSQFLLGPMASDELRAAITGPARAAGLELEAGLVELLLSDLGAGGQASPTGGQVSPASPCPGAGTLPLLAHALLTTWQHREQGRLTVAGYRSTGGITGAVASSAEQVYAGLVPDVQAMARRLLLGLVRIGDADQDTRRRVHHRRLVSSLPEPEAAESVLRAFADARLLTMDADCVELTHEALLYAWPRLRGWIDADRVGLRNHQRLAEAAEAWEASGHDPAVLYRGTQLAVAVDWLNGRLVPADSPERRFLDAGVRREQDEAAAHRRRTRRLRHLVALLSALVLLTAGATGYALRQRTDALAERDHSAAQLAVDEAERLRQVDPSLAMRLSLAAHRVASSAQTRGALLASSGSVYSTPLPRHRYTVRQVAFHDSTLATAAADGLVRLTDVRHRTRPAVIASLKGRGPLTGVAITSDGRLLAAGGADATVTLWALSKAPPRRLLSLPAGGAVSALAISPDAGTLAAVTEQGGVRVWDLTRRDRPVLVPEATGGHHRGPVNGVAFSPDGRTLATAGDDHTVRLWRVNHRVPPALLSTLRSHRAQVRGVTFAPNGRTLASVSFDQTVHLTPVGDPREPERPKILRGHKGLIHSVAFRSDGRQLVTGGDDQTARLWDLDRGRELMTLPQPNPVRAAAFGPEGALVTGDDEGRLLLWQLPAPVVLTPAATPSMAYARNGRLLVTADAASGARLWKRARSGPVAPLATVPHPGAVNAVAVSPDGRLLATAGQDRRTRLWDVTDPRDPTPIHTLTHHTDAVYTVAMSEDGNLLVTGGEDHTAQLWDIRHPSRPTHLAEVNEHTDRVNSAALSGDGRLLATAGGDYRARLWDLSDRRHPVVIADLLHPNQVNGVELSPDKRLLATTDDDRKVRLWRLPARGAKGPVRETTAPLSTMIGHREASRGTAFAPDGRTLATTSDDRTTQLWDVTHPDRPVLLTALHGHTGPVLDAEFSPDGRTLATTGQDATVRFWSHDVSAVIRRVCALDGPLNREEWAVHFPQQPYRRSCGTTGARSGG
ncbi:helix-turn-helix domain-containing protein [Streptomyces sp. G5(2025)]|uniref:nSTAND1 domain-containing NTPase n=1 Tax=Streptomyces sp. G5(2025) TaxID=3406628 RepID=UPI003C1C4DA7